MLQEIYEYGVPCMPVDAREMSIWTSAALALHTCQKLQQKVDMFASLYLYTILAEWSLHHDSIHARISPEYQAQLQCLVKAVTVAMSQTQGCQGRLQKRNSSKLP